MAFNFKDGVTNTFATESATISARGLGGMFAAKASAQVVRTGLDMDNTHAPGGMG